MKKIIKRYNFAIIFIAINILLVFMYPTVGIRSVESTRNNVIEMFSVVPPIFILLGLLDVWVKKETMIKLMGEKSGFVGIAISFLMGSVAAGPLYAAFPVAGILLKKGTKLSNVFIFIGAWSTTKIPLLLFESSSIGFKFMFTRFIVNIVGIGAIAFIIEKILSSEDKKDIYKKAEDMI